MILLKTDHHFLLGDLAVISAKSTEASPYRVSVVGSGESYKTISA